MGCSQLAAHHQIRRVQETMENDNETVSPKNEITCTPFLLIFFTAFPIGGSVNCGSISSMLPFDGTYRLSSQPTAESNEHRPSIMHENAG
jgi:hypothetical protein